MVETLFESELFGHVRGAFTGATEHKAGLFEAAHEGTLFLDEIGELPLTLQAKLLRVLENGAVQRVGAVEPRQVDACVFAATNRDLRAGRRRRPVSIGPAVSAERRRSAAAAAAEPARRHPVPDVGVRRRLRAAAQEADARRDAGGRAGPGEPAWDGNVRELRNTIERGCMLAESGRS